MATKSAAEWLASLDTTAIRQHLAAAQQQDEEDGRAEVRKGHCRLCGDWSHFRPGEPELCYGCHTDPFSDDEQDTD